jgi:GNAT superfamily N-acetyltransferase
MFADTTLAARIERAEAALSADIAISVLAGARTPDAFVETLGGGGVVYTGPGSPVNKLIGVGFAEPPDAERLAAIESRFARLGCGVQAEISTLADPAWHAVFAPRGYSLAGFENVLGLALDDAVARSARPEATQGEVFASEIYPGEIVAPEIHPGEVFGSNHIVVAECGADEAACWLDVIVSGFAQPDAVAAQAEGQEYPREAIERVFEDLAAVPGFRRYLARVDGVVVGGASMREFDGVAQLCGAATLPAFRRRGVQTALLNARLRDARRRGCDLAVVTTAPGSKSQQNAQRRGFALLYARALHVKPSPA